LSGSALAKVPKRGVLRILKIRHSTFLVDLDGIRILFDPAFQPNLGLSLLYREAPLKMGIERMGGIDLVAITSDELDHLNPDDLDILAQGRPHVLVPSEEAAKRLRHHGHRRVRVARPGRVIRFRGISVVTTPVPQGPGGHGGVGYRLEKAQRSLWHPGSPPPLYPDDSLLAWARHFPTEVLLGPWDGAEWVGGQPRVMGPDDSLILGALCQARFVIPQHDGLRPNALGQLLLPKPGGRFLRKRPKGAPRVVIPNLGRWYRVR
jgi:L-ascorbate metabolism protein UlaG (beta-lactamase superfamily)